MSRSDDARHRCLAPIHIGTMAILSDISELMTLRTNVIFGLVVLIALGSIVGCAGAMSFPYDADVTVTYLGGDAGNDNEFGISSPTMTYLGMGHSTPVNTVFNAGTLPSNTDLILYIRSSEGTFYSEGTSADGYEHAKITDNGDGSYTIGFEDLKNLGDKDFNDIIVKVTATETTIPVPEFPTPAIVIGLLFAIIGVISVVKSREA